MLVLIYKKPACKIDIIILISSDIQGKEVSQSLSSLSRVKLLVR